PLIFSLLDSTSGVRRIAASALARIDERWSSSPEAKAAIPELRKALNDQDVTVRHFVGQVLRSLGEPELTLAELDGGVRASPDERKKLAVSLFLGVLSDPDRELRRAAAAALGRLGDPRASTALSHALTDADPAVRKIAMESLKALG